MLERVRRDQSRLKDDPVGTAFDAFFARENTASKETSDPTPSLGEVLDMWSAERQPPKKTLSEWNATVRRFKEVCGGDLPIGSITKGHVRDFKDALIKFPSVLTHNLRKLTVPEIIAASERSDRPRLSPTSVNKHLTAIRALLSYADKNGYREGNPATGVSALQVRTAREKRLPYATDDLVTILASLIEHREGKPSRFWIPMLALYTGARMDELGQLHVSDVRRKDGIDYLDFNAEEEGKSLKTKSSKRDVPIHPELIRAGFLEYVSERRKRRDKMLFPELKPDALGKLTGYFSKWYGIHARKLGITDPRKVFHSFRHTFKDACRAARISEEVHDALTGHAGGGVGRTYGGGVPLDVKAEAIAKITYNGLDHSNL